MLLIFPFGGVYAQNQDQDIEEMFSQDLDHTPLDQLKAFWDKNKDKPLVKRQYKGDFDKFYKAVKGGYEIYDKVQVVNEPDKKRVKVIIPKFDTENYYFVFGYAPNGKYDNVMVNKEGFYYFPYSYADPSRLNSIFNINVVDYNTAYPIVRYDYLLQEGKQIVRKSGKWMSIQLYKINESQGTYFWDLEGHWAYDSVINGAKKGFIKGYPDATFKPNNSITRAEYTKALVEALGLPVIYGEKSNLVGEGKWYTPYYYSAEKKD